VLCVINRGVLGSMNRLLNREILAVDCKSTEVKVLAACSQASVNSDGRKSAAQELLRLKSLAHC
jgi:hypothetical protein